MHQVNKIRNSILVKRTVKDVLFLKIPEFVKEYMTLEIFMLDGKKIFENILLKENNNIIEVPIQDIEKGTYLIHINHGNSFIVDTFEKQ